jgi:hypothetical protein
LTNIAVFNCDSDGINFGWCLDSRAEDLYVEGSAEYGIVCWGCYTFSMLYPHVYLSAKDGIRISEYASDICLLNPISEINQQNGIVVRGTRNWIISPHVYTNSQETTNTYSGITLEDATYCTIFNGKSGDATGYEVQKYGVYELATSDYNLVSGVNVNGNATKGIIKSGANTKVSGNIGYTTENSGVSTGTGAQQGSR